MASEKRESADRNQPPDKMAGGRGSQDPKERIIEQPEGGTPAHGSPSGGARAPGAPKRPADRDKS